MIISNKYLKHEIFIKHFYLLLYAFPIVLFFQLHLFKPCYRDYGAIVGIMFIITGNDLDDPNSNLIEVICVSFQH